MLAPKIVAQSVTSFEVMPNLFVNIQGKFGNGYQPKWQFVGSASVLNFEVQDNVARRPLGGNYNKKEIVLQAYEGNTILAFYAYVGCYCSAELDISNRVVLNEVPRRFALKNFQKLVNGVPSGQPCVASSTYTQGGWDGDITLAADKNGKISMQIVLRNKNKDGQYSYIYTATATMSNLSPYSPPVNPPYVSSSKATDNAVASVSSKRETAGDKNEIPKEIVAAIDDHAELRPEPKNEEKEEKANQRFEEKQEPQDNEGLWDRYLRWADRANNAIYAPILFVIAIITFFFLLRDRRNGKK